MNIRPAQTSIDLVMSCVKCELEAACIKFPKFHSTHEGYAVVLEELDEAWEAIKKNDYEAARAEMIQVAAMAVRFLLDCAPEK